MLWYVTFVSILNIGLGYALAVYLGASRRRGEAVVDPPAQPITVAVKSAVGTTPHPFAANSPTGTPSVMTDPREDEHQAPLADDEPMEAATEEPVGDPVIDDATGIERNDDEPQRSLEPATPLGEPAAAEDPEPRLVTRAYAEQIITRLAAAPPRATPAIASLVELDGVGEADPDTREQLLEDSLKSVWPLFGYPNEVARFSDQQLLIVLPEAGVDAVAQRLEQLRQRIAAKHFAVGGIERPANVTCTVTEIGPGVKTVELLDNLEEALSEAKRHGGNCTYMHDGLTPAPVVTLEMQPVADT